jgi:hypothetical protein
MPIDPQDGGLDDWFVPESDGYPDDWFVPASAAPATTQPAPGPQLRTATRRAPRPDPLAAFLSLIPATKWVTPPPIFPDASGRYPSPPTPPPSVPRIDPTLGLFGGLANLSDTSSAPVYGLFGTPKNPPSASSAAFPFSQGAGPDSGNGDRSPSPSLLQKPTNDSGNRTDQTEFVLDPTPTATTAPFSESNAGLAQPISCQGPTCSQGGSFGMNGMYIVSGRRLCRDCAVKFLGIQDLPAAEQTKILQNFLR